MQRKAFTHQTIYLLDRDGARNISASAGAQKCLLILGDTIKTIKMSC